MTREPWTEDEFVSIVQRDALQRFGHEGSARVLAALSGAPRSAIWRWQGDKHMKFVPDEVLERNIARDLRHTPTTGEGSGGWVMSVRYLTEALAAARTVTGDTSDGYHTFDELYDYRKAYNALLFNQWAALGLYDVHKAWKHHDGEPCFGGGWFIVVAQTPEGQISNHYKTDDWPLFQLPERERGNEWDGHTPQIALERLLRLSLRACAEARRDVQAAKEKP